MKYKVAVFVVATTLFIGFYFTCPTLAATLNSVLASSNNVLYTKVNDTRIKIIVKESATYHFVIDTNLSVTISPYYNGITADVYYADYFDPLIEPNKDLTGFVESVPLGGFEFIINLKGNSVSSASDNYYSSLEDYEQANEPAWWESVWDTFIDYMTNPVLGQWMDNLIAKIWGDDNEGTIAENVDIGAPTLAPTPTPIPYSTIVVPKTDIITGETVYETNYYYENPDGTPTVAPYPPTNTPSNDGGGDGNSYTPVNGEPFSIPRLNWLTSVDIGDNNYDGIDSIYEGIGSINGIGSEYTDGLSAAQDATGTLPDSWLLLIGVAAAIPLIAGVISRFLS